MKKMKPNELLSLIGKYRKKFEEIGVKKIKHQLDSNPMTPQAGLCHCYSMLDHIEKAVQDFVKDGNTAKWEKAQRWIGFVQGVFWSAGVYTITDIEEHNRGQNGEVKK